MTDVTNIIDLILDKMAFLPNSSAHYKGSGGMGGGTIALHAVERKAVAVLPALGIVQAHVPAARFALACRRAAAVTRRSRSRR